MKQRRAQSHVRLRSGQGRLVWLTLLIPALLWGIYVQLQSRWHPSLSEAITQETLVKSESRLRAVLVLGGDPAREVFAAEFARQHPDLPIWVSSGSNPEYTEWVFTEAGVDLSRVHMDYQAKDTVTNFTTLANLFQQKGIKHVYLITSDYHMRRASTIGEIVLGSRGITFESVPVPSKRDPEPVEKAIRDSVRAWLWVNTGQTVTADGR